MQAAWYERTGAAREVLEVGELPTPEPARGEVRVRIAWSGVNPSDVKSRGGRSMPFPRVIPHSDGAGVIDAVGADVPESRIGEQVWVWNAAWGRPAGTAAEYVVLPAEQAVPLPPNVTDVAIGACMGIPALTAYHAVHVDRGVSGRSVLIAGGAGAVGHYAVQLARRAGAGRVIATVSGAEKAELARTAGADVVINYRTEDVAARVLETTGGAGVERIIEVDFAANITLDLSILQQDGDVVVYGSGKPEIAVPFGPMIRKNVRAIFFIVYNLPGDVREAAVADLTSMLAEGALTHNIAERMPLARIAEAHELVEQGRTMGNVVLSV